MKIYLVRHPETIRNGEDKITGWEDSDYTENGKKQFEKILKFFKGFKEDIYTSDLDRCLKLAKAISKQNNSKLIVTGLLREQNFKETLPLGSFETENDAKKRVIKFFKEYKVEKGIIVSHAGLIKEIMRDFLDEDELKEHVASPRDTIFVIERNKKTKSINRIRV